MFDTTFLLVLLVGFVVPAVICAVMSFKDKKRQKQKSKFKSLGDVVGKSQGEILAVMGEPSSQKRLDENQTSMVWNKDEFVLGLLFESEVCVRRVGGY